MRQDLDDALVRDFGALFCDRRGKPTETRMRDGFACGDGWAQLIRRMAKKVDRSAPGQTCAHRK
jgi:hypothetical protein